MWLIALGVLIAYVYMLLAVVLAVLCGRFAAHAERQQEREREAS